TEGYYLDDTKVWPRLLMDELTALGRPAWVGNAGVRGLSARQHGQFLASDGLISQVDCVVALVGFNDLSQALAGENEVRPVRWDRDLAEREQALLWFGRLGSGAYLSVARLREGMDGYNERLRAVCAQEGVEYVDLGSMNGRAEYFYDDCHFNEAGSRVADR